jgi:hypothetical protein
MVAHLTRQVKAIKLLKKEKLSSRKLHVVETQKVNDQFRTKGGVVMAYAHHFTSLHLFLQKANGVNKLVMLTLTVYATDAFVHQ